MLLTALLIACASAPSPPTPPPPDPCVEAWASLAALHTSASSAGARAPSEAQFLGACRALPEAARPCMHPRRAAADPDRCAAASSALSRPERRQLGAAFVVGAPAPVAPSSGP